MWIAIVAEHTEGHTQHRIVKLNQHKRKERWREGDFIANLIVSQSHYSFGQSRHKSAVQQKMLLYWWQLPQLLAPRKLSVKTETAPLKSQLYFYFK